MDSRKLLLLGGALTVAGVTAFAARTLVVGASAPPAEAVAVAAPIDGPEVLVATRALPVGTILDATALKFQPWPKELVDNAYYLRAQTDLQTLQGTVVRNAITAGQPVTQGALVKPGDRGFLAAALGPGMRAVTVPVSAAVDGAAGFVFPGDRIDMVLTQSVDASGEGGGDRRAFRAAETIIRNIRVLATGQRTDNSADAEGKTPITTFSTVTVEATPKIAEQIAVAQQLGTISLSLRSLADTGSELEEAIASGSIKVPDGADPRAEKQMMLRLASQPQTGNTTFATGGDVSRFARRALPANAPAATNYAVASTGGPGPAPVAPPVSIGPVVRIARGNDVSVVPVGGKN